MSNNKHFADLLKVCSILPALAIMPAMAETHTDNLVADSAKMLEIGTGDIEIYKGALSGDGVVYIRPGSLTTGEHRDTTAVFEGSIADFTGAFRTTQWANGDKPNAMGILVLKDWADGQNVTLETAAGDGKTNSGIIMLDGKNNIKLTAERTKGAEAAIYITNGAKLDNTSNVDHTLYFGGRGQDSNYTKLDLKGYKSMDGATLFAGGSNNTVNGDVDVEIEDSIFKAIYGNGRNTNVNGNLKLDAENVSANSIIGNAFSDKSFIEGKVIVDVSDSDVTFINAKGKLDGTIIGISLLPTDDSSFRPLNPVGVKGDIIVNVEDSVVGGSIRGANSSAGYDGEWMADNFTLNNIEMNVSDTVVGTEIIGMGSNMSTKGDITINMKGANAVGYTDLAATTESDADPKDITVRVGAKRAGTEVAGNTTLNIDTDGGNKVFVNGILNPGNESNAGYVLGNAVLNMTNSGKGYGQINAKTIETFNIKGTAAINVSNVTVNVEKIAAAFDEINIGERGVLSVGELNLKEDSVLNITLADARNYGTLNVKNSVIGAANSSLQLLLSSAGEYKDVLSGEIDFEDFASVSAGSVFDVELVDNLLIAKTKSIENLAADTGLTTQAAGVVASLANSHSNKMQQISLALQEVLNSGNTEFVEQESKKLNPEDKPVAQSIASSVQNQVLSLASGRMSGGAVIGRAGGDSSQENGFWMHGLFNKSKLDGQFHGYTRGVAFGMDTVIDNKYILGGGLAFNNSDVHSSGRGDTDIDSKTLFLYGQYKPNNWFANMTLTYNMSEYDEETNVLNTKINDIYDVDSYGAQIMGGYDFNTGITTEIGLRYLHIAQDEYTKETGAKVSATNTDFLTSVAGIKYAFAIENDWTIKLRPELHAALTYDLISEADAAVIDMPGVASYKVAGDNLDRLGGEFGIGLTADYEGLKITLMYDLDLHKDYTSQTGMIKFRTQF